MLLGQQKMECRFGTMEITPIVEEIRNYIDTIGTGLERRVRKQEEILIPNNPSIEDIIRLLGLGKYYAYWSIYSSIAFIDLYVKFGNARF